MPDSDLIEGQCMCGAVSVSARLEKPNLRACHCDMCRRWTTGMFMSIPTAQDSIRVDGPVRRYRSSDWAERAFCENCGSSLWYATTHDQQRQLSAGLFANAGGARIKFEFYSDKLPEGYALAGDSQRRMTEAECEALFAPKEGNSQ